LRWGRQDRRDQLDQRGLSDFAVGINEARRWATYIEVDGRYGFSLGASARAKLKPYPLVVAIVGLRRRELAGAAVRAVLASGQRADPAERLIASGPFPAGDRLR